MAERKSKQNKDNKPRPPEQIRRIGRALIALAQAQAEAEAQAEHERAKQTAADDPLVSSPPRPKP